MCIRNFTDGCEIYFITPTAWYYIKSLGQTEEFLAFVLTSFDITAVIVSPIIGHVADRFGYIKFLVILTYVVKVLGNLLYSINVSAVYPLIGRIVSGMGESAFGILMGQVALYTSKKDRGTIFVMIESTYCLGNAFGPAIGSFVTFNANILGWKIDAGNSPGIILTIIWFISLIGALFLPNDFIEANKTKSTGKVNSAANDIDDDEAVTDDEQQQRSEDGSKLSADLNSRVLCLFYLIFWNMVFSSAATFYTPLIASEILHLQLLHVKFYFLNSSLATLILFISVYIGVSLGYLNEKRVFIASMALQIVAISLLITFAFTWDNISYIHWYLLFFYVTLGMPYFAFSSGCSLLSKITDPRNSAFFQGTSFAILHLSIVASRILGGFVFTKIGLQCFSIGLAFFWLIGVIWFGILYTSFKPIESESKAEQ